MLLVYCVGGFFACVGLHWALGFVLPLLFRRRKEMQLSIFYIIRSIFWGIVLSVMHGLIFVFVMVFVSKEGLVMSSKELLSQLKNKPDTVANRGRLVALEAYCKYFGIEG